MKFLRIPVVVLIVIILISCADYDPQKDQKIGEGIIVAISAYKSDHNVYPATLDNLLPKYIETIPLTSSGDKFHYFLSPGDGGYSLCFSTSSKKRSGCCYLSRFDLWDCTEGD